MTLDLYTRDAPAGPFAPDGHDGSAERAERDWHEGDIEALRMRAERVRLVDGREVDAHVSRDGFWALVTRDA